MARCAHAILPTLFRLDGSDSVRKGGTSAVTQLYARAAIAHPAERDQTPLNFAGRFSWKAATPSRKSSEERRRL
jgi:hypothetical protein